MGVVRNDFLCPLESITLYVGHLLRRPRQGSGFTSQSIKLQQTEKRCLGSILLVFFYRL